MDSHIYSGFSVSPYYDPMIAKLIVTGTDRPDAVRRLQAALAEFEVGGIKTNIPFMRRLVAHPDYVKGEFSTAFVPRMMQEAVNG